MCARGRTALCVCTCVRLRHMHTTGVCSGKGDLSSDPPVISDILTSVFLLESLSLEEEAAEVSLLSWG